MSKDDTYVITFTSPFRLRDKVVHVLSRRVGMVMGIYYLTDCIRYSVCWKDHGEDTLVVLAELERYKPRKRSPKLFQ